MCGQGKVLASNLTTTFSNFDQIYRIIPKMLQSTTFQPFCPQSIKPWCTILDRFCGNFCEKNIPPKFCKKIDCGLCLRHGIMSLFNAQQSFVELEVIFWGVKNSGNQQVHQKTLSNFVPFGNTCKKMCQTIDWLYKTVLSKNKIFLCFSDTLFSIEKSSFVLKLFYKVNQLFDNSSNGTKFHNVFCWTSWLPEFFTPLKMTSSSTNDCWVLKRDIIPCRNHNPQSIFLQNFGGIFFSQKLPPNRSRIEHYGLTKKEAYWLTLVVLVYLARHQAESGKSGIFFLVYKFLIFCHTTLFQS